MDGLALQRFLWRRLWFVCLCGTSPFLPCVSSLGMCNAGTVGPLRETSLEAENGFTHT